MVATTLPLSLLVVEDNQNYRESIIEVLEEVGHQVCGIDCAEALPEQANLIKLDIAILDLNLPGEDGLSLARRLREMQPHIGIIMLTARIQSEERAVGYASGADIYLSKPVSLAELEQAVLALARRLKSTAMAEQDAQTLLLNTTGLTLSSEDQSMRLTVNEAALLTAFVRNPQHMLENWQIAEVLGMDLDHFNKSMLEIHIVRLRKKIPTVVGVLSPIQAVRGIGYALCVRITLRS